MILERGERLADCPEARDDRGDLRPRPLPPRRELAHARGRGVQPGQLLLCRRQLEALRRGAAPLPRRGLPRRSGISAERRPAGRSPMTRWSPGISGPRSSTGCAATRGRTRPSRGTRARTRYPPVPDEPSIADLRARLKRAGVTPSSLPLGIDLEGWLRARRDAVGCLPRHHRGEERRRERRDRRRAEASERDAGDRSARDPPGSRGGRADRRRSSIGSAARPKRLAPGLVILSAGAVNSAVLLLRSRLANRSGPGRAQLHEPQLLGGAGGEPIPPEHGRLSEDAYCQRLLPDRRSRTARRSATFSSSGKISGPHPRRGERSCRRRSRAGSRAMRSIFYAMSEDLPDPASRVTVEGDRIVFDWRRSNWEAHEALVARLKAVLRRAGFPLVLSKPVRPAHALAPVRHGADGHRSGDQRRRRLLPRPRPPEPLRGRRELPADLGGGEPGADHRRAGAALGGPHHHKDLAA